ncbi:helix-turn-helix domain-containing protein, partial [Streptosporangium sp. NPDC001682]
MWGLLMRDGSTNGPAAEEAVGRRIAQARKLRGLTQQQLADRVPCSKSLITQVERGHKPATQALITAVARTLRIELGELT